MRTAGKKCLVDPNGLPKDYEIPYTNEDSFEISGWCNNCDRIRVARRRGELMNAFEEGWEPMTDQVAELEEEIRRQMNRTPNSTMAQIYSMLDRKVLEKTYDSMDIFSQYFEKINYELWLHYNERWGIREEDQLESVQIWLDAHEDPFLGVNPRVGETLHLYEVR